MTIIPTEYRKQQQALPRRWLHFRDGKIMHWVEGVEKPVGISHISGRLTGISLYRRIDDEGVEKMKWVLSIWEPNRWIDLICFPYLSGAFTAIVAALSSCVRLNQNSMISIEVKRTARHPNAVYVTIDGRRVNVEEFHANLPSLQFVNLGAIKQQDYTSRMTYLAHKVNEINAAVGAKSVALPNRVRELNHNIYIRA